jgi:hypothetical protein
MLTAPPASSSLYPALHEPIAWGGPIVMNSRSELLDAFHELDKGTFLKKQLGH